MSHKVPCEFDFTPSFRLWSGHTADRASSVTQFLAVLGRRTEPMSAREGQSTSFKPAHALKNSPVFSAPPPGYPAGRTSLC